jgi:hypothetical protein
MILNYATCLKCGEHIYSREFDVAVTCSCGNVIARDGQRLSRFDFKDISHYSSGRVLIFKTPAELLKLFPKGIINFEKLGVYFKV